MTDILDEADFTKRLLSKLALLKLEVSQMEPLSLQIDYGGGEPRLTIHLDNVYEQYKQAPEKLDSLLQPFLTEISWTLNSPRFPAREIYENVLPVMRNLSAQAKEAAATEGQGIGQAPEEGAKVSGRPELPEKENWHGSERDKQESLARGPLVRQELVNRSEEHLVIQFALKRETELCPLRMGDILPSFPDERQLASIAMQNLKVIVLQTGLTMSEFPVDNFENKLWLIGFRGGKHTEFLASLITVPEVMESLEKALSAADGVLAIAPSVDQLLLCSNIDEEAVCEMGLLAGYLKRESRQPVSGFVWRFKGGFLERVQAVDLEERTGNEPSS